MTNRKINKGIIKAISVGMSAAIAMTPISALAEELGDEGQSGENNAKAADQNQQNADFAAVETAVDVADAAVDNAVSAVKNVTTDVASVKNDENLDEVADAQKVSDDFAKDTSLSEAGTAINTAETMLDAAATNDTLADAEAKKVDEAVENADDAAEDLTEIVEKADEDTKEQLDSIKNAETIADAQDAYADMQATVEQATEDFNAKLSEYNSAVAAYDEAVAKLAEYEEKYQEFIDNAENNLETAEDELSEAQELADELKSELEEAKKAVEASVADALKIAKFEKDNSEDSVLDWRLEDGLFEAVVKGYYLPEVAGVNATDATVSWTRNSDHTKNYCTVKYTENGETKTIYLNYMMVNQNDVNNPAIKIFEKREVEVFYADASKTNPDYYVIDGKNVTPEELATGVADGTYSDIISLTDDNGNVTGYYELTEVSSTEFVSETTTADGNVKTVVDIDESSVDETYKIDEEGNLVKTVTGDVTTYTYTTKSLSKDATTYSTNQAARAAAQEAAQAAGLDGTEELTVEVTEQTVYTITGKYIPIFSASIDVNEKNRAYSANGAKEDVYDDAMDDLIDSLPRDINVISESDYKDLSAVKTKDYKVFEDEYQVTGTINLEYEKTSTKTVDLNTFDAAWSEIVSWFTGVNKNHKKISEKVEADGDGYVDVVTWDWNLKTAKVIYVQSYEISATGNTVEEARANYTANINAKLAAIGATGYTTNGKSEPVTTSVTTYGYNASFVDATSFKEENATISQTNYGDAEKAQVTGEITQNLNYINNEILLNTETNETYRDFVDSAVATSENYAKLIEEAEAASKAVETASAKVDELQAEIAKLENTDASRLSENELASLKASLSQALKEKEDAEDVLDDVKDRLDEAGRELQNIITRLTPAPTNPTREVTNPTNNITNDDIVTIVEDEVPLAVVQLNNVEAVEEEAVVEITEEETPLAPALQEETVELAEAIDAVEENNIVTIVDEVAPLADSFEETNLKLINWWWMLLIVALGGTGFTIYKNYKNKKAKATVTTSNSKDNAR